MAGRCAKLLAALVLTVSLAGCGNPAASTNTGDAGYILSDGEYAKTSRDVELDQGMWAYDSDVSISTKDFDASTAALSKAISDNGCVLSSDFTSSHDMGDNVSYRTRSVSFRVPVENLEAMRAALEGGDWKVESLSMSGYDMASTYHDYEAELDSLQKRYDWYAEQLSKTEDESLASEYFSEMSSLIEQMDGVKRQMEDAKTDEAWASCSVYLFEDVSLEDARRAAGAWQSVGEALIQLPARLAYALGQILYFLILVLPYGLVIAVIVLVVRFFTRNSDAKRDERRAERLRRQGRDAEADAIEMATPQQDAPLSDASAVFDEDPAGE